MYTQHFGLAQYPFSLSPDTRYFLKLPSHQRAFNFIVEALNGDSCFTKITGEVGTGKTMLCRKVLGALAAHENRYSTVFIPNPVLDEEGIMHAVAEELGLSADSDASYYELLKIISEEMLRLCALKKTVVLFIDEAQAMTEESLEAIRLLTTIENSSDGPAPLKVILFGQPELDELLLRPALHELNRDISDSYLLSTLDRDGVETYLNHRLSKAGYNGASLFSQKAVELIYSGSGGVPRLINILAHKALMVAFGRGDHALTDTHIKLAIEDTETAMPQNGKGIRLFSG